MVLAGRAIAAPWILAQQEAFDGSPLTRRAGALSRVVQAGAAERVRALRRADPAIAKGCRLDARPARVRACGTTARSLLSATALDQTDRAIEEARAARTALTARLSPMAERIDPEDTLTSSRRVAAHRSSGAVNGRSRCVTTISRLDRIAQLCRSRVTGGRKGTSHRLGWSNVDVAGEASRGGVDAPYAPAILHGRVRREDRRARAIRGHRVPFQPRMGHG